MIDSKSYNKHPDRNLTNVTDEEVDLYFQTISYNVREIRKAKGLSQLEVALSIGQKSSGWFLLKKYA